MTPAAAPEPIPSTMLTRVAVGISIAVHVAAVAFSLGYAGAGLFDVPADEAIPVSLVTPEQVPAAESLPPPNEPKPEPDLSKLDLRLSPVEPPQPQASADTPKSKPEKAAPSKQQQAAVQSPSSAAQPAYATPEPDISMKYQVDLGLKPLAAAALQAEMPSSGKADFDDVAMRKADIDATSITTFRTHLKQCAALPAQIGPDDKVIIVLRATFLPDGKLAADPTLIEASASAKGPALMQAAVQALQSCQPHTTLPPDKYAEWRVLDLRFTPQDFRKG